MDENFEEIDILITGGTLLPMTFPGEIVENPLIGIRDGRILFVEKNRSSLPYHLHAATILDAAGCIVMPGLVNCHTHLGMTCFRGLADDLPLMTWLTEHIFPAEAKFINPDTVYTCSLLGMAEMILSGTTTFCDGYFFEDEVGKAAIIAGMRAVIARGFLDFPTPDAPADFDKKGEAKRFVEDWRNRSPLIFPSLICHSLYTCAPETLQTIHEVARQAGVPLQIHLAETKDEVRLIRERYGKKPVELLRDLGLLSGHLIAGHGIWLDDDELKILSEYHVKVAHDPESNMKLGAGVAPVPQMLAIGIDVGLGTDGCASNNDLDMFGEMSAAAKLHKVFSGDPTAITASQVVEMATIGGARVLGMARSIGSIAPGKEADIILVDMRKPHLTPSYNPFSTLVYAARGADVATSIIHGRLVMKDRRIATIDTDSLLQRVRRIEKWIKEDLHIP
jgi:5-methylthioadenosine/S-adenosylhomocysteine deaminase